MEKERLLPSNIDMEKALLCSIMIDEDYQEKLKEVSIRPEYFYLKQHQYIYEAIEQLQLESRNVDILTLPEKLKKMSKLNEAGGFVYLTEIYNTVSTSANLLYYAEIIENKYLLRILISTSTGAIEDAYTETLDAKELLDNVSRDIFLLSEKKTKNTPEPLENALKSTYLQIEEWSKKTGTSGITSGFKALDDYTSGWQNNTMVVLAARPGMGKTQLALNFAVNAASSPEKTPVAIFSLEMGKNELAMRLMAMEGRVSLQNLKKGKLTPEDWQRVGMSIANLSKMPIYIDDSESLNILELRTKCRRLKKDKNIGMVIVDYIGLMQTDSSVERHEGISRISRALKGLSKELEIPIFALSQLNREVDKRPDKKPMLSDLRESGAIEQDADMVLFILRPEVYAKDDLTKEQLKGKATVIIGKQRSGPTGEVPLHFESRYLRFDSVDRYSE